MLLCSAACYWVLSVSHAVPSKRIVSRDPFYLEQASLVKKNHKKIKKTMQRSKLIMLEGIMAMNDHVAAVINDGNESEVVAVGDRIWGYVVKHIDSNSVVLAHGSKTKTLVLDE